MATNRITRRGAALAALLLTVFIVGCGGGGSSTTARTVTDAAGLPTPTLSATAPPPANAADVEILDKVLGRQEAAAAAYARVTPELPPHLSHMAGYFRRQEQEHVDSIIKVIRGLKGSAEPTPETIEVGEPKTTEERLVLLYEVESSTIDEELSAISKLEDGWPRSLLASTVANQAQHLTLLRHALGAGPLGTVPAPFENGTYPPPVG
jgi:Ferritin-like domain